MSVASQYNCDDTCDSLRTIVDEETAVKIFSKLGLIDMNSIFLRLFYVYHCVQHGNVVGCGKCLRRVTPIYSHVYYHIMECHGRKDIEELTIILATGGMCNTIRVGSYNSNSDDLVFVNIADIFICVPQLMVLNNHDVTDYIEDIADLRLIKYVEIDMQNDKYDSEKYAGGKNIYVDRRYECFNYVLERYYNSSFSCVFCDQQYDCLPAVETVVKHFHYCYEATHGGNVAKNVN